MLDTGKQLAIEVVPDGSSANDMARRTTKKILEFCDVVMRRRRDGYNKKPVYWWTEKISTLRKVCLAVRRKAIRRPSDEALSAGYKIARKELKTAIRSAKCKLVRAVPYGREGPLESAVQNRKKLIGKKLIPGITEPTRVRRIVETLFSVNERKTEREKCKRWMSRRTSYLARRSCERQSKA